MASIHHTTVKGIQQISETELSDEELANLNQGKDILSCRMYKYSELSDDKLEELLELCGIDYILEIRPDFIQRKHPELRN